MRARQVCECQWATPSLLKCSFFKDITENLKKKGWRIIMLHRITSIASVVVVMLEMRCKRIRQWLSKETNPNNPTSSLWLVFSASALHNLLECYCPTWYFKHAPPKKNKRCQKNCATKCLLRALKDICEYIFKRGGVEAMLQLVNLRFISFCKWSVVLIVFVLHIFGSLQLSFFKLWSKTVT